MRIPCLLRMSGAGQSKKSSQQYISRMQKNFANANNDIYLFTHLATIYYHQSIVPLKDNNRLLVHFRKNRHGWFFFSLLNIEVFYSFLHRARNPFSYTYTPLFWLSVAIYLIPSETKPLVPRSNWTIPLSWDCTDSPSYISSEYLVKWIAIMQAGEKVTMGHALTYLITKMYRHCYSNSSMDQSVIVFYVYFQSFCRAFLNIVFTTFITIKLFPHQLAWCRSSTFRPPDATHSNCLQLIPQRFLTSNQKSIFLKPLI